MPYKVSIHAPAGGATIEQQVRRQMQQVSIHAPAGGATAEIKPPLPPMGVSIHAPAGGATRTVNVAYTNDTGFNPRARRGRDDTHGMEPERCNGFNPRARRGRDAGAGIWPAMVPVSIHAPAGGATRLKSLNVRPELVSIHAPAGGATRLSRRNTDTEQCFNPRARRGRDHKRPIIRGV